MKKTRTIIEIAEQFIGVKEKPNNSGFYENENVLQLTGMQPEEFFKTLGWQTGWAWCAFIPKACWYLYYTQFDTYKSFGFDKLFSPSVATMQQNFENESNLLFSKTPEPGAIVIWRSFKNGKKQWTGHTGIVTGYSKEDFVTIEGNTSEDGSREGEIVAKKVRTYNFDAKQGLVLQGFILPASV